MIGIQDWVRDVLLTRGALVESDEGGVLRAMLPEDVAAAIGSSEWLSLDFRPRPGADDPVEWMERAERLLPAGLMIAGSRLRMSPPALRLDAAAVLGAELAIQNGICRLVEDFASTALYVFFTFRYTVESDERSVGFVTVSVNSDARSLVLLPENFLRAMRDDLEDGPVAGPDVLAACFPAAAKAAQPEIRKHAARSEESSNRRLARDSERVESYYQGLLAQIEKRVAKRAGDTEAAEKERSRARATEADRVAKLEDLRRKYSLRIRVELAAALSVRAPVRQISVRLIRKKAERPYVVHWNPTLGALEPPLCEGCRAPARPVFLCENVHCLCRECWVQCPRCSRFFCRACQPRCKCGNGAGSPVNRQP